MQRRHRLGQPVRIERRVGEQHLGDAVELRRRFRDRLASGARDQHMDFAAESLGRGERLGGGAVQRLVVVLGDQERGHQITPALFSFSTSSAGEPSLTPALRPAGSVVFSTFSRGATSTP